MPKRRNKRKIKPPVRYESGDATEDNKKRWKELAEKNSLKSTKRRRKVNYKYDKIESLAKWLLEAKIGTTGVYHGKELKVIEVNDKVVKCIVENATAGNSSSSSTSPSSSSTLLESATKVFTMPNSPLPSEAVKGSWYWVWWSHHYYRCQVAKIITNNVWQVKFEGVDRLYRYKHNGVFSTHVKAIDVWPDEGSESVEEEAEEEEEDSSEEENTADDSSIEENDDEEQLLITPNLTPSGKNSLSTTCKQTQVMDLNHDSETTILNGMTIIASSSSSSIGSRASSSNSSTTTTKTTTRTTTSSTPKINQKEIKRHKNKIQLKYSNKKEALTLFSKEIMEFKSLLDNKAISEATYKEWVAKAKANYDTVHTIESQT